MVRKSQTETVPLHADEPLTASEKADLDYNACYLFAHGWRACDRTYLVREYPTWTDREIRRVVWKLRRLAREHGEEGCD